jgi:hypothetical protein
LRWRGSAFSEYPPSTVTASHGRMISNAYVQLPVGIGSVGKAVQYVHTNTFINSVSFKPTSGNQAQSIPLSQNVRTPLDQPELNGPARGQNTGYMTRTCPFNNERRVNTMMGAFLTARKYPTWSVSVGKCDWPGNERSPTTVRYYCTDGRGHWMR